MLQRLLSVTPSFSISRGSSFIDVTACIRQAKPSNLTRVIHPAVVTEKCSDSHLLQPRTDMDVKPGINPSSDQGTMDQFITRGGVQYAAGQPIFYTRPESTLNSPSSGSSFCGE